ncbi:MAG: hypothetical protein V3U54_04425 [Thermodesulfobacteriota bacterium]
MTKKTKAEEEYFSYFSKLYESWEKSTHQAMKAWIKNPLMEQAVEKSGEFKKYIQEIMDQNLEYRYFPLKKDIDSLKTALENIEEKLDKLENTINTLIENSEKKTKPFKSGGK